MIALPSPLAPLSRLLRPFGLAWVQDAWPRAAQARLASCLLLAGLLHVWLVLMLGNAPPGTAPPGQGVWGALNVTLRGVAHDGAASLPTPPLPLAGPQGTAANPRVGGAVRPAVELPPFPPESGAAKLGDWAALPAPPPGVDGRLPRAVETRAEPALHLPAALPLPLPMPMPLPEAPPAPPRPTERRLLDLPAAPAPTARVSPPQRVPSLPSEFGRLLPPAPAPLPVAAPLAPPPSAPLPVASPAPPAAVPTLGPDVDHAPGPAVQTASPSAPAPAPTPAQPVASTVPAGPSSTPAGRPDAGPHEGHDVATAPSAPASAPRLNLALPRQRGGELSRQGGTGVLLLLPRPPELPDKLARDIDKAAKADCRKAYQGLGVLAVLPLAVDAVRGGKDSGCKW